MTEIFIRKVSSQISLKKRILSAPNTPSHLLPNLAVKHSVHTVYATFQSNLGCRTLLGKLSTGKTLRNGRKKVVFLHFRKHYGCKLG